MVWINVTFQWERKRSFAIIHGISQTPLFLLGQCCFHNVW